MHVVLVVPGGVDRGGEERVIPAVLSLIEGLAAQHRVTVVALGQEATASIYPLLGATVVNVPPERHGPHRLARQLARAVRAAGTQGRPDVVHGLWASVSGLAAVLAARRYRVPSLVHVAGGELVAMPDIGYGGALGRGGRMISRFVLRRADHVTVASEWLRDQIVADGYRVDEIVVLGADTARFRPDPTITARPHHLVHIASLNRVKDQTTLLHAMRHVLTAIPGATMEIVGVDTLGGEMQRLAAELGVDHAVTFCGYLPSRELPPIIQRAAVNVISSRHEAGPLAVVEAAACGVPTVGTAVGHIADLAAARPSTPPGAVAVPIGDAVALGEAIIALLLDDARRAALGQASLDWAVHHGAAATVAAFDRAYQRVRAMR